MTDWKIPTINGPYKLGTQNYFTYPLGGYNPTYRIYVTPLITGFEACLVDSKRARHGDVFIGHLRHLWLLQQVGGDGFLGKMFEVLILVKPGKFIYQFNGTGYSCMMLFICVFIM